MGHHKSIIVGREAEYLLRMHDPLADKHTTTPTVRSLRRTSSPYKDDIYMMAETAYAVTGPCGEKPPKPVITLGISVLAF